MLLASCSCCDTVPVLAKEYGADEEAVWDAIRCELALEAA